MRARADWYPDTWPAPLTPNGCAVKQTITELSDGTLIETVQRLCVGDGSAADRGRGFSRTVLGHILTLWRSPRTIGLSDTTTPSCSILEADRCPAAMRGVYADHRRRHCEDGLTPRCRLHAGVENELAGDERGPLDEERVDGPREVPRRSTGGGVADRQAVNAIGAFEGYGGRPRPSGRRAAFSRVAFRCAEGLDVANPVCRRGLTIARADLERWQPVMDSDRQVVGLTRMRCLRHALYSLSGWDMPRGNGFGHPLFFDDNHPSGYANRSVSPFTAMLHRDLQGPAREAPGAHAR